MSFFFVVVVFPCQWLHFLFLRSVFGSFTICLLISYFSLLYLIITVIFNGWYYLFYNFENLKHIYFHWLYFHWPLLPLELIYIELLTLFADLRHRSFRWFELLLWTLLTVSVCLSVCLSPPFPLYSFVTILSFPDPWSRTTFTWWPCAFAWQGS